MASIGLDKPGTTVLLMGNEAVARGVIEAGVGGCVRLSRKPDFRGDSGDRGSCQREKYLCRVVHQ